MSKWRGKCKRVGVGVRLMYLQVFGFMQLASHLTECRILRAKNWIQSHFHFDFGIICCQRFYAKLALSSIRWINIRRDSSRLEFYVIRITEAIIGGNIEYCFSDFHVCSSDPSPLTMVFLSREYMHLQSAARVGGTAKDSTPITRTENRHQKSRKWINMLN